MTGPRRFAVARDFLTALGRLPRGVRSALQPAVLRLRDEPGSARWAALPDAAGELWALPGATVVGFPLAGGGRLLAWVGPPEVAEAWARTHSVQESSAGVHLRRASGVAEGGLASPERVPPGRLLAGRTRAELVAWGVPDPLLPAVAALRSLRDLDELTEELPLAAADAIRTWLDGGVPDAAPPPDPRERVVEVPSDSALQAMLGAPLDQWRVFLHPSQRALVELEANGPVRVLGGAGTGKTVALLHRAARLARQSRPGDRLLVTTFTRNLARDLDVQLGSLLDSRPRRRVEVTNLHRWAVAFLRRQGVRCVLARDRQRRRLMEEAALVADQLGLSARFYIEEWDQVVQAWEVLDRRGYLRAPRAGRGTGLTRRDRLKVWDVLASYRASLDRAGLMERADVVREARILVERVPEGPPFRHILADEVQDFTPGDLRMLRALVPRATDDLFLVGDPHQRIYGAGFPLSHCGIEIVGRGRRLRLNYRTTEAVRRTAMAALQGLTFDDLDDGDSDLSGTWSLRAGQPPTVSVHPTRAAEMTALVQRLQTLQELHPAEELCVAARTRRLLEEAILPALEAANIAHSQLESTERSAGPGVRVATLHRLKGLEFRVVLLVGVEEGVLPAPRRDDAEVDTLSRADAERQERCLFYVAATRARDALIISGVGRMSDFVSV